MANEIDRYRLEPRNGTEAWELARVAAASGLYGVQKPEQALVIIMTGTELGLTANQALRSIQVVKGKPNLSADLIVALVKRSEICESWEVIESTNDRCTIETKRRGDAKPRRVTWTLDDAKRAGISGDMYQKYPRQMLRHRCSADLAREVYPDLVLGLYAPEEFGDARDLGPDAASVTTGVGGGEVVEGEAEQVDPDVPPVLARVRDDINQLGGKNLTVAQAEAIWRDHYKAIVDGGFRDRAAEMLELALGEGLKTKFKKQLGVVESEAAAAKRKVYLEGLTAKIRATKGNAELAALVQSFSKEERGALVGPIWAQKVAFCSTLSELARLLSDAKEHCRNESLLAFVRSEAAKRQREIEGPGDDGGPDGGGECAPASSQAADDDPEREAIQAEGAGSLETQALAAAVDLLRRTNGPRHAISHYLAHRSELSPSLRAEYRAALLSWLPARYPQVIASRAVAEAEIARAEESSVLRAA
jgi:hypothetical protein